MKYPPINYQVDAIDAGRDPDPPPQSQEDVLDALGRIATAARAYQIARASGYPELEREAWLPLDAALVDFFFKVEL